MKTLLILLLIAASLTAQGTYRPGEKTDTLQVRLIAIDDTTFAKISMGGDTLKYGNIPYWLRIDGTVVTVPALSDLQAIQGDSLLALAKTYTDEALYGIPAGNNKEFQYNNGGTLSGAPGLIYDKTYVRVGINKAVPRASLEINSGTGAILSNSSTTGGVSDYFKVYCAADAIAPTVNALYIVPSINSRRLFFGRSGATLYSMDLQYVSNITSHPSFTLAKAKYIGWGGDATTGISAADAPAHFSSNNNVMTFQVYDAVNSGVFIFRGSITGTNFMTIRNSGKIGIGGVTAPTSNVSIGNYATSAGSLDIKEDTDDGTNYSGFTVAAQDSNFIYTLPVHIVNGGALTVTGSGTTALTSWTPTLTQTQLTDLTDAGNSTLHVHDIYITKVAVDTTADGRWFIYGGKLSPRYAAADTTGKW